MGDKLPKYTRNQQIGNRSASILKSVMQRFCIFTELDQSQDLGIDFIETFINNSYPTTYNFYTKYNLRRLKYTFFFYAQKCGSSS